MIFFEQTLSFFLNTSIVVIAIIIVLLVFFSLTQRNKNNGRPKIRVKKLNSFYESLKNTLQETILDKKELKQQEKASKKATKKSNTPRKKVYVLNFNGDVKASQVEALRHEITAVLTVATPEDEIIIRLESPGGMVHGYGLAASQLKRIRDAAIPLTITVDKVAASGGYMMACVANKIIAAPFAIIGSIGVVVQLPNFNKLLEKNHIEYEQLTAGEYKRTLTLFGKNTEKGREKLQEEIEETQALFKAFIRENRPQVNIEEVATGEHWFGQQAINKALIDELKTSDDYLFDLSKIADLYEISQHRKQTLSERFSKVVSLSYDAISNKIWNEQQLR